MKRIILGLLMIAGLSLAADAKDTYGHDASALPKAAQSVIKKNFKTRVGVVKIDKDFGRISEYEATLTDGSEISFDRQGNWKNVEAPGNSSVPSKFIPKGVSDYVSKTHKGMKIVSIEKERSGYEVELSNGIDIKFNQNGDFVRYDD